MGDIAKAMGVTRTAIYYYFRNKDDILRELTSEITGMAGRIASDTLEQTPEPIEALEGLVRKHARLVLSLPLQFRVVERNEELLAPILRKKSRDSRRLVLDRFVTVIEAGIAAGQFRDSEPKVTAFALLGMCNWCAWWFNPKGKIPLEQVVDSIADLALNAVVREENRRLHTGSIDETMRQLREDINLLEMRLQKK